MSVSRMLYKNDYTHKQGVSHVPSRKGSGNKMLTSSERKCNKNVLKMGFLKKLWRDVLQ